MKKKALVAATVLAGIMCVLIIIAFLRSFPSLFGRYEMVLRQEPKTDLVSADWSSAVGNRQGRYTAIANDNRTVTVTNGTEVVSEFPLTNFFPDGKLNIPDYTNLGFSYNSETPIDVAVNSEREEVYALFVFGNSHYSAWALFKTSLHGREPKLLESSSIGYPERLRISADSQSLGYVTDETVSQLNDRNEWVEIGPSKHSLHIVDLTTSKRYVIQLPEDDWAAYIKAHGLANVAESSIFDVVAAWRISNGTTVEFSRYFARGNEVDGYTQISDKELWSYDIATGKLTLLEMIPFEQ